jgi:hypothetical protein
VQGGKEGGTVAAGVDEVLALSFFAVAVPLDNQCNVQN